ncbi:hypothetical protein C5167_004881 [Papaver somniferum]|uniref:BHLH domain-containing protein n=1 Tax=Papaver somniferum TaxID=3469 RepID=A0A4Y7JCE9_PAPSO|nr:transcription factor bHLH118-like [Papaver somniferum]RZC57581.1 hypothetical protein C5167_004881 [Papaver somniferum]
MNFNDLYPLQQSNESICQISKSCEQPQQKEPDNNQHIVPEFQPFSIDDFNPIFNIDHPASNSSAPKQDNPASQRADESKKKMVVRRDVERLRRQEMANLHASLRSLLPLEYIKGKRSASDHMNEATKYIKNLQKVIVEMKDKRDELNRLSINNISKPISVIPRGLNSFSHPDFVTVRPCVSGLEVVISSDGLLLPLSRVLRVLLEDGLLTVVSCVSTRVNEKSLHTIQIEVSDLTRINTIELEQKLIDLV